MASDALGDGVSRRPEEVEVDESFMRLALAEARKGTPSPNPHVGALVVQPGDGVPLGVGFHARQGREHAELAALQDAKRRGNSPRGATLYVTLEPCNHHGRTPPCTEAILAAGIARVVVGMRDPNPGVRGGGNASLRSAGIEVVEGVLEDDCVRLLAAWTKHVVTGRPYLRLKLASSLDGRIAAAPHASRPDSPHGVSRWITGSAARLRVHALRARVDAVAVGIGTALADDPELTPRDADPIDGRDAPMRVVFDSDLRLPLTSRLVQSARITPVCIVTAVDSPHESEHLLRSHGVNVVRAPRDERGRIDLARALDLLGQQGVVDLLVEGGAHLAGSLIERQLVDELTWYLAPIVLGDGGLPALVGPSPISPDLAQRFEVVCSTLIGDGDLELLLHPKRVGGLAT